MPAGEQLDIHKRIALAACQLSSVPSAWDTLRQRAEK
jgi:hypothetical protein